MKRASSGEVLRVNSKVERRKKVFKSAFIVKIRERFFPLFEINGVYR